MARTALNLPLLVLVISSLFFTPMLVTSVVKAGNALSDFTDFAQPVEDSDANTLSGVYVPDVLALPVIQQPPGDAGYVSNKDDQATQFGMASQLGTVGLLAHNYLSGRFFSKLTVGQEVRLVYGNGKVEYFNSSCYHDLKVHEVSATVAVTTPKRSGEPHGQPDCSHILSV